MVQTLWIERRHEAVQIDSVVPERNGEQQHRGVGRGRIEDAVEDRADQQRR